MASQTDVELKKLTEQFICVRLVQMGGVDLSVFQFDPFLSWSVFFMNGDRTIYGRYGRASPMTKRANVDLANAYSFDYEPGVIDLCLDIHRFATGGRAGPEPFRFWSVD